MIMRRESLFPVLTWSWVLLASLVISATAKDGKESCIHGRTLPDGACDCYSCWFGYTCSQYTSRPPQFASDYEVVTLRPTDNDLEPIFRAVATDPDKEFCKEPEGCPCSNVTYFFVSQHQASNFHIDKITGDVTMDRETHSLYPEYQLTIGASDDGTMYDTMTLVVHTNTRQGGGAPYYMDMADSQAGSDGVVDYSSGGPGELLSRHRRAVTLPSNVTFNLSKWGKMENVTEIRVGIRIQFKLEIIFPSGTTDIQVELFAPDSTNIVMMLCNVQVTVGTNLQISGTNVSDMDSSVNGSNTYDRAIIRLGNVSNNLSDMSSVAPSTIVVLYEAVMIESSPNTNNTVYEVSAGAEYNNESDVWVGQASFTAITTDDSASFTDTPLVTLTGNTTIPIGSCTNYTVDLTLNRPVTRIQFDMFAPFNVSDVLSICLAKVVSVNDAYKCGLPDLWYYEPIYSTDSNTVGFHRVHIDMGRPINKYAREYAISQNSSFTGVITFGVQICLNDNPDFVSNNYVLGSAIQLGNDTIWAGNLNITATPKIDSQKVTPTFDMRFLLTSNVSKTKPGIIQLDMQVPENSYADYLLEVMAPVSQGLPIFQVCAIRVAFAGENMACLGQRAFQTEYIINSNSTTDIYADVAVLNLGRITNAGTLGWTQNSSTATKNLVSFYINYQATNHPEAIVGSSHDFYFGMYIGPDKLTVGKIATSITADSPPSVLTTFNKPLVNMSIGGDGSDSLYLDRTVRLLLDIKTVRNTSYQPFQVEFIMPNSSGKPVIKICKIQVQSVGANTPCVVPEVVERSFQMISSFSDDIVDRAVLNMTSLCNIEQVDDEEEDHVILAANVVLMNQPSGISMEAFSGYRFDTSSLEVARIDLQADLAFRPAALRSPPYLAVVPNNGNFTKIPVGFPFKFLIRIKILPNDSTPMTVNVSTMDNALSICSLRLLRAADAYPCLEPANGNLSDQDPQLGLNRGANMDLKYITNVGSDPLVQDDRWDTNTIELEMSGKVTVDSTLAPDKSTHSLKFVLNYDEGYVNQRSETINITVTSDTSIVNDSLSDSSAILGSMMVASITGQDAPVSTEKNNTIVKRECKRAVIDVVTALNSTSQLKIDVTTPTNLTDLMEIVYIGLLYVGDNLPCLNYGQTRATYQPRQAGGAHTDIATLDLGFVCNTGLITNDSMANKIRVESVVRLLGSAKVSPGDSLQIHGAITTNGKRMNIFSITLQVDDDTSYVDVSTENLNDTTGIALNLTQSPILIAIAETKVIPVVFTVTPFTSAKLILDAVMPVNSSAILTIKEIKIVKAGSNLPQLERDQGDCVLVNTSKYNTSQVTRSELNLGVVSNSGVTYRFDQNKTDDDSFSVEVTVQCADSVVAQNQTQHTISFGLHGPSLIYILDVYVTILRTGQEQVMFNITSATDLVNSTSSRVEIDTILRLSDLSTAEGQNTVFNLYLPAYVTHLETTVTSPLKAVINTIISANNVITHQFGVLFFTDEVHMTTVIISNSSYYIPPGITGQDSICKLQAVADSHTDLNIPSNMEYVNFTIATTTKGSPECGLGALGMENNKILDCQLSSSLDSNSPASQGRYGLTGLGWSPFVHTGTVKVERFFQVYFGNQVMVTQIKLQQTGSPYVTQLRLRFSNDGLAWIESSSLLSVSASDDVTVDVIGPQVSRYLRVMVVALTDETQKVFLKFEFIGCVTVLDGPSDNCTAVRKVPQKSPDFNRRTFIYAYSKLFVCDGIKYKLGIKQKCFSSEDGLIWADLGSQVGCILGYDSLEPRLYAMSANGLSYMSSSDSKEWMSIDDDLYNEAKVLPSYKPAIEVPLDGDTRLNSNTPHPVFTDSNYGATVNGLVNTGSGTMIFTWGTCCPTT